MSQSKIFQTKFPSQTRTISILLLLLFCVESLLMKVLPQLFPSLDRHLEGFLDAALLTLVFAPVLNWVIFKPFQQAAAAQKTLTDNVLAHIVDGVVLFDQRFTVRFCNAAAERILGYRAAELAGADVRRILGSSTLLSIAEQAEKEPAEYCLMDAVREGTGQRRDGREVPIELSLSQVQLSGRWMWLGIIRDISARKQDDDRLKNTLSLLSATLESTADGIMVRDLAGKTIIWNERFGEMWGFPKELMATHDDKLMRSFVQEQLKDPQRFVQLTEEQYRHPDQESRDLLLFKDGRACERFSAPHVVDGRVIGRVICYRDVTEQRNLEHQLRHAQKMEALGTLAGGVAHDFNNILTVIMGFCNLTASHLEKGSDLRHNLDQIMTASERALTLTNSLLAYSRKQPMNRMALEINKSLQQTERFLARLIGEEIELVTRLCGEKMVVMADRGQLEQVLMNLAANARDAMSRKGCLIIGSRMVDIDQDFVRLHGYGKPGPFALISVSDTGTGMDEKTRDKIFEPFFTTKEIGAGTGLGLSIVYGIVKQHDGYINVYSEPGKGTTFNIYLPLVEKSEDAPRSEQRQAVGGNETILLAEDDAGVRALVKSVLSGAGYRVIEASDGLDAVQKFRENSESIDLLVLDVVMPNKNGREVLKEIGPLSRGIKTLFISGYTADIIGKNGLIEAGLHLINKPVLPNQLLNKVREVLDEKGGRKAKG